MEDIEIIPIDIPKKLELKCKYCNKLFKSSKLYEVHILKQPCLKTQYKSNCLICMENFDTRIEYENHIVTRNHYNTVSNITDKEFKWKSSQPILNYDNNVGFTINYDNLTTDIFEVKKNLSQSLNDVPAVITNEQPMLPIDVPPVITNDQPLLPIDDRKKHIINYLSKIKLSSNPALTFYKLLTKLKLADYNGLYIYIIRDTTLADVDKKIFITIIIKFIRDLELLMKNGQNTFENKDISQIIANISNKNM